MVASKNKLTTSVSVSTLNEEEIREIIDTN
jgi:hypothetical protein